MAKVTKAVIAAAGFGTRFLPQTKAMPKEMLPLVNKPVIQYIVEDLVAAGIQDIIIVGSSNKRAIEDHFDMPSEDLVGNLKLGGASKRHYIDEMEAIAGLANFVYVRQKGTYGTATPLMNVAHLMGREPFLYVYADDLTVATPNAFQQLIAMYQELGASIFPCIQISKDEEFNRYGVLAGELVRDGLLKMTGVAEKPGRENAPSDFASVGGYLLTGEVFDYLEEGLRNLPAGKEFETTADLFVPMLRDNKPMYGYIIQNGVRYDTGTPLEYLKTLFSFALRHEELGPELRAYLRDQLAD
jgi:UTP--glucose-1-phosphate uridylyltransferase